MKKSLKYYIVLICLYILIFQNLLQTYIHIFQFFDEILALSVIPVFIITVAKNEGKFRVNKRDLIMFSLLLLIFVVGIIANIKYKYQPLKIAFSDALLVYKFFMVYFLSKLIMTSEFIDKYNEKYLWHIKKITLILFILSVINYIFKIWPSEVRYGIMSNKLFYNHPTSLAAVCIFLLSCLLMSNKEIKNVKKTIILLLILMLSTMRSKAIASAIISLLVIIYVNKCNKKISLSKLGILGVIGVFIAWSQIEFYYFTAAKGGARAELTNKAIQIAKDYFPIGTGFGTYASYFSGINYSPVYYKYQLNNVYGLSKGKTSFISDTFWPMIMGQFGMAGFISYIIIIILLFINIQKCFDRTNKGIYLAKMTCLIYLLISSTAESAFVHTMAIPLAVIIGAHSKKERINR